MLGKLIKHEFKSTGRYILLLIIALAVITPITALYIRLYNEHFLSDHTIFFKMLEVSSVIIYVVSVIACVAATYIILLFRFYKSMITRESYLTHTLPVKKSSLLISKILVAAIWTIISYVVAIISIGVFTGILGVWHFSDVSKLLDEIRYAMNFAGLNISTCILFGICIILSPFNKMTQIFACFSIGQRMNRHPILGTLLAYVAYSGIIQILVTVGSTILAVMGEAGAFDFMSNWSGAAALNLIFSMAILVQIVLTVVCFIVAEKMFRKKLNV